MVEHCCDEMQKHVCTGELHLYYDDRFREYGINYRDEFGGGVQLIASCPWCATTLPTSLRNAWFSELDRLGLGPEDDLPERMRSSAWWQHSGL
jgi:hypothetical protein